MVDEKTSAGRDIGRGIYTICVGTCSATQHALGRRPDELLFMTHMSWHKENVWHGLGTMKEKHE